MRWSSRQAPVVPSGELAAFAGVLFQLGYGVEPADVAERFNIPESDAAWALARLVGAAR
jgi:hypothetical protein